MKTLVKFMFTFFLLLLGVALFALSAYAQIKGIKADTDSLNLSGFFCIFVAAPFMAILENNANRG